jgi:hypothetical protein
MLYIHLHLRLASDLFRKTLITYSMVQDIIWKADCYSVCQILLSFWNLKIHYRVHKSPPMDLILSQSNPVRPNDSYLPKVHLSVIPHLRLGLPIGLLPSWLPTKNPINTSPLSMRVTCPGHLILLDLIILTIFGEFEELCASKILNMFLISPIPTTTNCNLKISSPCFKKTTIRFFHESIELYHIS